MKNISNIHAFKRNARPILAGLVTGLCFIWVNNAFAVTEQHFEREAKTCSRAIEVQERREKIPKGLLTAISLAESGRWDAAKGENIAWPWTVTTGGKGYFLPNRADAVAFVKSLQADGIKNIDVGCLQINLMYHPDSFVSIEHAFAPESNAAYAAKFLAKRFSISKSWLKAAGDYHSTTPALNKPYRKKVATIWNDTALKSRFVFRPKVAPTTPFRPSSNAQDMTLTKRFNESFRSRSMMNRPGQAIANRVNALRPGAQMKRKTGLKQASAFAQKRQSQLMAWRQTNGTWPQSAPSSDPKVPSQKK